MRHIVLAAALMTGLAACGSPSLDDETLSDREFDLERYFDGQSVAYGQFMDRFGSVQRRFKVTIDGDWDGEVLTLTETFRYDDGGRETRVWRLTKTGEETWEGTAEGVQGVARGEERGDTFNWSYVIDLPRASGETIRVKFDDWMWLMEDGRVLNKAYMSKAGVRLGEVTIFFEKQS